VFVFSRCQRLINTAAKSDNTAFSKNTQIVPTLAISAPANRGPKMRDALLDTPLSANAAGSSGLATTSGVMAA
jgi:hypothetical protein